MVAQLNCTVTLNPIPNPIPNPNPNLYPNPSCTPLHQQEVITTVNCQSLQRFCELTSLKTD